MFKRRDVLGRIGSALPYRIVSLDAETLGQAMAVLHPFANDASMFVLGAAVLMHRLATPWQVIRIGTTNESLRDLVAELALGRIEAMLAPIQCRTAPTREAVCAATRAVGSALAVLRSELGPQLDGPLARRCREIAQAATSLERIAIAPPSPARLAFEGGARPDGIGGGHVDQPTLPGPGSRAPQARIEPRISAPGA